MEKRVDVESEVLRPADTKMFRKYWTEKPFDFPNLSVPVVNPPVWVQDPLSSRAQIQNQLLLQRHFDK